MEIVSTTVLMVPMQTDKIVTNVVSKIARGVNLIQIKPVEYVIKDFI